MNSKDFQLSLLVDEENPESVLSAVKQIFCDNYTAAAFQTVENLFRNIEKLFAGDYPGYAGCNTDYHDLTHTLEVFLATARLMDGWNISDGLYPEDKAVALLCAALLHDTGYLQRSDDTQGTGAKYTQEHVARSCVFAVEECDYLQLPKDHIDYISDLITCTGLNTDSKEIFTEDQDVIAGAIIGSSDLLGQMADRAYLEKLLFLYYEFKEAGFPGYNTEFDILKNTMSFYEMTKKRLEETLLRSYRFAEIHFSERHNISENLYLKSIQRQMDYLQSILDDSQGNFRAKLHRIDLEKREGHIKVS